MIRTPLPHSLPSHDVWGHLGLWVRLLLAIRGRGRRKLRGKCDVISQVTDLAKPHSAVPRHMIDSRAYLDRTETWKGRDEIVQKTGTSSAQFLNHDRLHRSVGGDDVVETTIEGVLVFTRYMGLDTVGRGRHARHRSQGDFAGLGYSPGTLVFA